MSGTFKIQEGHPIDENLRPIRIGDDLASLEISRFGSGAKVTGDLIVTGNIDTIRTTCIQSTGDISIEAGGNIALDTDGGYVNLLTADNRYFHFTPMGDGGVEFGVRALTSESDIFKISVGAQAGTTILTTDDGGTDGDITFQADGNVAFNTIANKNIQFTVGTKTQSDPADYALSMIETLDLSSGASGSDNHYGLRYKQTQTNIAGWDNVYLMYLDGGSGKILSVDGSGQIQLSNDRKIMFGDAGEYISGSGTDLTIGSSRYLTFDTVGAQFFDSEAGEFNFRDTGDADDAFKITVVGGTGATTLETLSDAADGHMTLDPDGELNMTPATEVKSDAPLKIKEAASAVADTAAYGQLWVKTATPNELYFTNDAGNDIQITSAAYGNIFQKTVTLSESDMNDLHNTEIELIAAQGSGLIIVPVHVVFIVDRDSSTSQGNAVSLYVGINGSTTLALGVWMEMRRFMWFESGDRVLQGALLPSEIMNSIGDAENRPLTVKLGGAITSGSIDSCKISIAYYILDNN